MSTDQKNTWHSRYYDRALREVLAYRNDLSTAQSAVLLDIITGRYRTETQGSDSPPAARYVRALQLLLSHLDREVVVTALVGDRESDLLDPEGQEVNRVRKFLDRRIAAAPVSSDLRRRCLTVLDAFADEFESTAGHNSSPSVDGGSSPTVGDAGDAEGRAEPPAPASQDGETADPMIDLGASLRSAVHHRQYLRSQLDAANRRITKYSDDLQITQECVEDYERRLICHVVGEVE